MFDEFMKAGKEVFNERAFKKMLDHDNHLLTLVQKAEDAPETSFEGVIEEIHQYVQEKGVNVPREEVHRLVVDAMPVSECVDRGVVSQQEKPGYSDTEDIVEEDEDQEVGEQ